MGRVSQVRARQTMWVRMRGRGNDVRVGAGTRAETSLRGQMLMWERKRKRSAAGKVDVLTRVLIP